MRGSSLLPPSPLGGRGVGGEGALACREGVAFFGPRIDRERTLVSEPKATHDWSAGGLAEALEFLKRTRWELRSLRKARLWRDRLQIFDVNGDWFEVRGIGWADPEAAALLRAVNGAFNPQTVHQPPPGEYREIDTGRRHPWAEDRVM